MKKLSLLLVILALGGMVTSCTPRMVGRLIGAAIITAVVVGTAQSIAHHDAHYHDHHCGCERHYHDGRWVYSYQGEWEYYDHETGTWYRYE